MSISVIVEMAVVIATFLVSFRLEMEQATGEGCIGHPATLEMGVLYFLPMCGLTFFIKGTKMGMVGRYGQ
jgi:hypothetical protein